MRTARNRGQADARRASDGWLHGWLRRGKSGRERQEHTGTRRELPSLGVKLRQWNGDGEPAEIEMRVGNVSALLALRAEYLAERLNSALPLAEEDETLSILVMDRCKLSLRTPLGKNRVE